MSISTTESALEALDYIGSGSYYLKSVPDSPLVVIVKIDPSSPCDVVDAYVRTNEIVPVRDDSDARDLMDKYKDALNVMKQDLEKIGLNNVRFQL